MLRAKVLVVIAIGAAACSAPEKAPPDFAPAVVALPGPSGGELPPPNSPPEDLPGVDTSELVPREKDAWWRHVSQLFAPCADQAVSVATCVKEARPCRACAPAARFLAQRIRQGATDPEVKAAYAIRFGPDVKQLEPRGSPSRGPASAPVTIFVWSDFECPACGRLVPLIEEIAAKRGADVRYVHKFYPLSKHPRAFDAARAAWAAQRQGKYWEMEKLIFSHQDALGDAELVSYAREIGLDIARFDSDRASDAAKSTIEQDKADADVAGLTATPFIVVNGRPFNTSLFRVPVDLEPWIDMELEIAGRSSAAVAAPADAASR